MRTIVVAPSRAEWPLVIRGIPVVRTREYLTDPKWTRERGVRVFNLCRSYRYQSKGYYVSLLAAARGHRPFPALMTVLDMRSKAVVRTVDEELDTLIQHGLSDLRSDKFELSIYFGRNVARRHARLAQRIFAQFPAPMLRASFTRGDRWRLTQVVPIGFRDVPDAHFEFLHEAAAEYFSKPRYRRRANQVTRYDLAILHDPEEELAPSDPKALQRFSRAAEKLGLGVEMIRRDDYGRLAEFDALFIRETTMVNHHTFRFAQRAETEGLAVIDDPTSILRCTNKVYQAEALERAGVPTPRTLITDKVDIGLVLREVGLPCVLKYPDSSFSQGVVKCADEAELATQAEKVQRESELLLVQEFVPTGFDWRVGVFDGEVLFACRYHMARGHWQIVKNERNGKYRYGKVESVPLDQVPARILSIGKKAAAVVGDGLYGVDLKQIDSKVLVMEVNDNPNINAGCEDALLGNDLYERIMRGILNRIEARRARGPR